MATLNDFIGITQFKGATGTSAGFNRLISGGLFSTPMMDVDGYDVIDWSPVFDPVIKQFNIAIGYKATIAPSTKNSIAIGNGVSPMGNDVVQLGWYNQDVLTFGEVGHRLDERDMVDIETMALGLDFIASLQPIKYKVAYREKVLDEQHPFLHPLDEPDAPKESDYTIINAAGESVIDEEAYQAALDKYLPKKQAYDDHVIAAQQVMQTRKSAYPSTTNPIGHYTAFGFTPSEITENTEAQTVGFNPFINKSVSGGNDVNHFLPSQMLPVLVNALKELKGLHDQLRIDHDALRTEFDAVVIEKNTLKDQMVEVRTQLGLDP